VTTVAGRCDCGCPSVLPQVEGRHVSTETIEVLYESELQVVGDDEEPVADVLLFLKSDHPALLEYVATTASKPQSWPTHRDCASKLTMFRPACVPTSKRA